MTFLQQVAFHEAGHAVSAWKHGAILTFLTADGFDNQCRHRHPGNYGHDPARIKENILFCCAGPIAETKAKGLFFVDPDLARDEMRHLLQSLEVGDRFKLPAGWDEDDYFAEHSAPARLFVELNWKLITALAIELHKRVRMSGPQVARFLENIAGLPAGVKPWQQHK